MNRIPALVLTALAATGVAAVPATTSTAATTVPACHKADVRVHYRYTDSGAGHQYGRIVMKNVSDHACRSGGFGGLSYVTGATGIQVGAAADRDGSWSSFTLKPGERAFSPVDEVRAGNYSAGTCDPTYVDAFLVYIPNATKAIWVDHETQGCMNSDIHLISHRAFRKA